MAVEITTGEINRDEVVVTLNVKMALKDWKLFYQEIPQTQPISLLVRDELLNVFNKIK
jgi:hypothetical protein